MGDLTAGSQQFACEPGTRVEWLDERSLILCTTRLDRTDASILDVTLGTTSTLPARAPARFLASDRRR